jgi:hypothetical protein
MEAARVLAHTCECRPVLLELCSGGGHLIRRTTRTPGTWFRVEETSIMRRPRRHPLAGAARRHRPLTGQPGLRVWSPAWRRDRGLRDGCACLNRPYRLIWDQNRADRPRRSVSVSSVFQVGSDRTAWIRTVLRYPIWVSVQQRPLPAGWRTRSICWDGAPTRTVRRGGHPGTCRRSYDTRAAGLAALNTDPASLTSAGVRARGTQRNARRDSREAVRSVRTRRIASVPNSMMNTPIVDEGTSWSRRPRQRWCGCQRPVR